MKGLKNRAVGGYILLAAIVLNIAAAVLYVIFGVSSGTFTPKILVCLLCAVVLGGVTFWKETVVSDFLSIAMTVILSVGLAFFIRNSVGDFTEMITPVGMYGNPANMPMRFVILGLLMVCILVTIVEGFTPRTKKIKE